MATNTYTDKSLPVFWPGHGEYDDIDTVGRSVGCTDIEKVFNLIVKWFCFGIDRQNKRYNE